MPTEIVFEDLHGSPDEHSVEVDLDADAENEGITRLPRKVADDDDDQLSDDAAAALAAAKLDDDDDDGGADDYSDRVQKRIRRETRAKRKAQTDADYWKGQAEKATSDLKTFRDDHGKDSGAEFDTKIATTESELRDAIEMR